MALRHITTKLTCPAATPVSDNYKPVSSTNQITWPGQVQRLVRLFSILCAQVSAENSAFDVLAGDAEPGTGHQLVHHPIIGGILISKMSFRVFTEEIPSCFLLLVDENRNVLKGTGPLDNDIMYVITTHDGKKGTIVDAYGAYADPDTSAFMTEVEKIQKKMPHT